MIPLTAQQERLWRFLKTCERCPSFGEMAAHMGLRSKSGVHRMISVLEAKGYVSRVTTGGRRRARALIVHDEPTPELPPLTLYTLNELLDEVGRRLPRTVAA